MDFSYDDEHLALREAVQRYAADAWPAMHRGNPLDAAAQAERLQGLADLGVTGLTLPEAHGGLGLDAVAAMVVAQELGAALGGGAWIASSLVAAPLLAEAADADTCARWLPAVAEGRATLALAVHETPTRHDWSQARATARREAGGWVLDGAKAWVCHGDSAALFIVSARTDEGLGLFVVEAGTPGLQVQGFSTLDGRRAAHLTLNGVRVADAAALQGGAPAAALIVAALDRGTAALVADATGAMAALVDLTGEQLRTRRQFGAPLAKFQALQHRYADMAIALEQSRSMACGAAAAVAEGDPLVRARVVSAAKALVGPLGRRLGLDAIQMHGAMGMTDECRVGHYAKRLLVVQQQLGDAAYHLTRFAWADDQVRRQAA